VKVGDFGVARLAEGSSDGASATIVGTPRYMAPEQARGRAITPATDVYSVGVVLYEMLTGRPPFTERAAVELALRHLNDTPAPLPAGVPVELREIVERALAKAAAHRYHDGREMADALARAQLSAPPRARRATVHAARTRQRPGIRPPARVPAGSDQAPPRRPERPRPTPLPAPVARRSSPPDTRRAELSPRRNVNPAGRRRSAAALALAFALLCGMSVAAVVLGAGGHVKVPRLAGLTRSAVRVRARKLSLQPTFAERYDLRARRGTVIGQRPSPGRRVVEGSIVRVVLSAGPPPVKVPPLAGDASGAAQRALQKAGLRARTKIVVAPGVPAGTVTSQAPGPGVKRPRGSRVTLSVAEVPRWQPLSSIAGGARAHTVRFHVRGPRWRVVYTMGFQGTCTWVVFCSGPSATVTNAATGARTGFGLSDGGRRTRVFGSGRGDYRLTVAPGSDSARWSLWVEDYY
jgi:serine/threonine-protein kinase